MNTFVTFGGRYSNSSAQMPGMTNASSITFLSTSTHAFSRAVWSVVDVAVSTRASTAGSRTDRFVFPPVARITRLRSGAYEQSPELGVPGDAIARRAGGSTGRRARTSTRPRSARCAHQRVEPPGAVTTHRIQEQ